MRVFSDVDAPSTADGVYLFSETTDNEDSGIKEASLLYSQGKAKKIILLKWTSSDLDYPQSWIKKLLSNNIAKEDIIVAPFPKDVFAHTHTEAIQMIEYAKQNSWKTLYVTASPLHQLRAFIEIVTIALWEYPEIKLYSKPGQPLSWTEYALHSQSVAGGKRFELVDSELEKINRYYQKGDLASGKKILAYLNQRDE